MNKLKNLGCVYCWCWGNSPVFKDNLCKSCYKDLVKDWDCLKNKMF